MNRLCYGEDNDYNDDRTANIRLIVRKKIKQPNLFGPIMNGIIITYGIGIKRITDTKNADDDN